MASLRELRGPMPMSLSVVSAVNLSVASANSVVISSAVHSGDSSAWV